MAKKLELSIAELVRRSIDHYLAELPVEEDPALSIVGLGRSGVGDLAAEHDRYDAFALDQHFATAGFLCVPPAF